MPQVPSLTVGYVLQGSQLVVIRQQVLYLLSDVLVSWQLKLESADCDDSHSCESVHKMSSTEDFEAW